MDGHGAVVAVFAVVYFLREGVASSIVDLGAEK